MDTLCSEFVTYVSQICLSPNAYWGFSGGSNSKESACNAGDPGLIPGSERSPGGGNGNLFQFSCLENSMEGGSWQAIVHGIAKSQTQLKELQFPFLFRGLGSRTVVYLFLREGSRGHNSAWS